MRGTQKDERTGGVLLNFEMCPIRQHDAIIKQVEVFGNLVISLDENGYINVAFISYKDMEEHNSYMIEEFADRKVLWFHYDPEAHTLFVVESEDNKALGMSCYQLDINEDSETAKVSATIYSNKIDMIGSVGSIVNVFNNTVVLSPDFRLNHPEDIDENIFFIKRDTGEVIKSIKNESNAIDSMNVDDGQQQNPIPIWDHFGTNISKDSIFFDQIFDRFYLPDYLCNLDVIDMISGKLVKNICIKEHRQEDEKEDRMSNVTNETIFSISALMSFVYITTNKYIYVVKRNNLEVVTSLKLSQTPIKVKFYPVSKEEITALRQDPKETFLTKIVIGASEKTSLSWRTIYHIWKEQPDSQDESKTVAMSELRVVLEGEENKMPEINNHRRMPFYFHPRVDNVHSVDVNNTFAAYACQDLKVSVIDMGSGQKYHLNAGSKVHKSYKDHPKKPGVSEIKLSDDKIALVLGNLIRVYCFDVDPDDE